MASMRAVDRHLEGGDWLAASRECGSLLESILHEIYRRVEPNLSTTAKSNILRRESNKARPIEKFTLGDLTAAFKAAGVLTQARTDFGRALPYLLQADWNTLVRLRNNSIHRDQASRADANFLAAYVSAFLEELGWEDFGNVPTAATSAIHPFELFKDFYILEKAVKPRRYDRSDQQEFVANVLLHSIQPAYYLDKLEVLQDYSMRVGRSPDFNPMGDILVDARTIVQGAYAIYAGLKRQEGRKYFERVKADLEVPLTAKVDKTRGSWPDAIRLDFLGLCFYHLHLNARKDGQSADAAGFLESAKQAFNSALDHLGRLAAGPLRDVAALWKGYALRNLGSVLADSGEPGLADESYKQALNERERVYQRLRQDSLPLIASQLLVEVELVKIDIANLEVKSEALAASTERLLGIRQDLPSVWPHVEERLYESAIALNAPTAAESVVLTAVEDRLSRLMGKKCARLIRDEVGSGKVIREAVASGHCARQSKAS